MSISSDHAATAHTYLAAVPDTDWDDDASDDRADTNDPTGGDHHGDAAWTDDEASASTVLFDGDRGGLELGQRRALLAIVKHRFISAETHPAEWKALAANPALVVSRLNDLFLTLHLDTEREVAWKAQATPEGGGSFPTLLYDVAWNREATIALVFLRSRQRNESLAGNDTTFVDREEILTYIESFRPDSATDKVGDARRAAKAVDDLYAAKLLMGRKTGDRFQVARAIEALLPLETLKRLAAAITATQQAPDTTDTTTAEGANVESGPDQTGATDLPATDPIAEETA